MSLFTPNPREQVSATELIIGPWTGGYFSRILHLSTSALPIQCLSSLSNEEVNDIHAEVITRVKSELGVEIR